MPAFVGLSTGFGEARIHADRLHRVAVAELPAKIVAGDELPEPGMKRSDVIILQVDLDERLPVVVELLHLDTIEHVPRKIEVACDA